MNRRAATLFAALGIAWGIPYLLIKVSVAELSPAMLVLSRTTIAALVLMPIALKQNAVRPVLSHWRALLAFTVAEIAIPWFFLNHAEQTLPSSTTGLLMAAVPLVGAGLAVAMRRTDRLGPAGWLGLLVGLVGVVALVGLDVQGSDRLAALSLVVVAVGYALGPVLLSRDLAALPGLGIMAVALTLVAATYLPVVLLTGGLPDGVPSGKVIASVVVLGLVCTALAFVMLFELTALVGPVRVTAITYLNPAVAVLAGAVVLSEPITGWTVLGFVLVLAGASLITRRPAPVSPAAAVGEPVPQCEELSGPAPTGPTGPSAALPVHQAAAVRAD
jgi:drug/metabolite transporter (DMT)-like permease